MYNTGNLRVT